MSIHLANNLQKHITLRRENFGRGKMIDRRSQIVLKKRVKRRELLISLSVGIKSFESASWNESGICGRFFVK